MDENSNNKSTTYKVVDFSTNDSKKGKNNFSRNVVLPFFSGILGATLVIGTCFGVPTIRESIIGGASVTTSTSRKSK